MARTGNPGFLGRIKGSRRTRTLDISKAEAKRQALAAATEEWLSLLREMEAAGQIDDPTYESYYRAYLQARQQERQAELDLFNARQGLAG